MRKLIILQRVPNSPNKWYAELLYGEAILDVARGYPHRVMAKITTWMANDDAELRDGDYPDAFMDDYKSEAFHAKGAH